MKNNSNKIASFLGKSDVNTLNHYLINHTKMVLNLGMRLADNEKACGYRETICNGKDEFMKKLALTLVLHDIGKIVKDFQRYLSKKKTKAKLPHKVYSWAYVSKRVKGINTDKRVCIKSAILYHHASYHKYDTSSNTILNQMSNEDLANMDAFYQEMSDYCVKTFGEKFNLTKMFPIIEDSDEYGQSETIEKVPLYHEIEFNNDYEKTMDAFEIDSMAQLIRAILIRVDRLVSGIRNQDELQKILDNDIEFMDKHYCQLSEVEFKDSIECVDTKKFFMNNASKYDVGRLQDQFSILDLTKEFNHNAIKACAGFGKTLLGLMWFLREKKSLLWVTSKNTIVSNTYNSIKKELMTLGLYDKVRICSYFEGNVIDTNCPEISEDDIDKYDILVTNIDSIVNRTAKNSKAHLMFNMYESHVIFDEYHEFKSKEAIFSAFIRLMYIRIHHTNAKTLLMSATASDFSYLWCNGVNMINDTEVLYGNETNIKVFYHAYCKDEKVNLPSGDVLAICQTVQQACDLYETNKNHDDATLIHARFTKADKTAKYEKIMSTHGDGKSDLSKRGLVIGTSIIGTGLDMSSKILYDVATSPESTIQRACGRCSRFGEYKDIEYHVCDIIDDSKTIVKQDYTLRLNELWLAKLKELNNKTITKTRLYELYEEFQKEHESLIKKHYADFFNTSSKKLGAIRPYGTLRKDDKDDDAEYVGKKGYRGDNDSVYVTAKDPTNGNNWSNVILVNLSHLSKEEKNSRPRKNFLGDPPKPFNYGDVLRWKTLSSYSAEECQQFAFCSKSPIPLFDYIYDSELGLRCIHGNDDNE